MSSKFVILTALLIWNFAPVLSASASVDEFADSRNDIPIDFSRGKASIQRTAPLRKISASPKYEWQSLDNPKTMDERRAQRMIQLAQALEEDGDLIGAHRIFSQLLQTLPPESAGYAQAQQELSRFETEAPMRESMSEQRLVAYTAQLKSGSDMERLEAIRSLLRQPDAGSVGLLVGALKDKNPYVRRLAARGIAQLGDRQAAGSLVALLRDRSPFVRQEALQSLKALTGESVGDNQKAWSVWWKNQQQQELALQSVDQDRLARR